MGTCRVPTHPAISCRGTPGASHNGARAAIHWAPGPLQRSEAGGGTIHFDDELIRRDGLFVPDDLRALNPDALKASGHRRSGGGA